MDSDSQAPSPESPEISREYVPKLRPVEAFPIEIEGQRMICLRDPHGIAEGAALLPVNQAILFLIQQFDGTHTVGEIQVSFMRKFGELLLTDQIQEMVSQLDSGGFLDSPSFRERLDKKRREYLELEHRPCILAPGSGEKAIEQLDSQWRRDSHHPLGPNDDDLHIPPNSVRGVLAPHIDYFRGGYVYAWSYKALTESCPARIFVILGTIHRPMSVPFAATRKAYSTPMGPLEVDCDFLDALQQRFTQSDLLGDEFAHSAEHSIELQTLYLKHALKDRSDGLRIVPILVDSFEEDITERRSPMERPVVRNFIESLRETIQTWPEPVCIIGGVDLSHVGPRFGDSHPLTDLNMETVARRDAEMLKTVEEIDPEAFMETFYSDQNARHVCSVAPMYCALQILRPTSRGKVLRYGQAVDPDRNGAVTFAGVVFTERD